jgi:hypothetical protein
MIQLSDRQYTVRKPEARRIFSKPKGGWDNNKMNLEVTV